MLLASVVAVFVVIFAIVDAGAIVVVLLRVDFTADVRSKVAVVVVSPGYHSTNCDKLSTSMPPND